MSYSNSSRTCRFLCRVVRCCRFSVSKVVAFIALAALSMLGACCLTTYGVGSTHCESGGSQNTPCYRRPDIDLPLTWFSVAICEKGSLLNPVLSFSRNLALAGVVSSSVLHLYDNAAHAWLRPESDGPRHLTQPTIRDSLELVKVQKYSNGNDPEQNRWVVPTRCPPPLYRPSPALLSSYILPSIPLRKRDMNKLGLTVITNIPMDSSSETPRKRWRGRGRDVWEKKLLGDSAKPEHK